MRSFEVYTASGAVAIALLAALFVLNRAGLITGPAWTARLGPWIAVFGWCLPLGLVALLYLGAAAALAGVWHDQAAWKALPVTEAWIAYLMLLGVLLQSARILLLRLRR